MDTGLLTRVATAVDDGVPAGVGDRRRGSRRSPDADEPLARVRLRAGRHLLVVDVSNAGILVEGDMRLLPGTHVDVHILTGEGRQLVRSRVVRAYVSHVAADAIRYRGALAFERSVDTSPVGYDLPSVLARPPAPQGSRYPADGAPLPSLDREREPHSAY